MKENNSFSPSQNTELIVNTDRMMVLLKHAVAHGNCLPFESVDVESTPDSPKQLKATLCEKDGSRSRAFYDAGNLEELLKKWLAHSTYKVVDANIEIGPLLTGTITFGGLIPHGILDYVKPTYAKMTLTPEQSGRLLASVKKDEITLSSTSRSDSEVVADTLRKEYGVQEAAIQVSAELHEKRGIFEPMFTIQVYAPMFPESLQTIVERLKLQRSQQNEAKTIGSCLGCFKKNLQSYIPL